MCQNLNCENYATTYREVYQRRLLESHYTALGESVLEAAQNTTKPSQLIEVWAMIGAQCADHPTSQEIRNGGSAHSSLMGIPLKDMIKSIALEAVCREWAGSPEEITQLLERLYQTADIREQQLIIRVLPLLKSQEHFVRVATEAARTNIVPVFSALALDNPFPQEHFNENQWNQMVLKAIFVGCDVRTIVGLHERHNSSLAETIFQYISERHSAQRSVPRAVVELCEQALSAASLLQLNAIKSALLQE
ncbi:MAG: EboA domain-containing protein [Planctomycetota bacterium]